MPKAERGSVKDIANRMKAKGLQKLKFHCQMCQKQCRDANGFKCHIQSDSHMRQMKLFGDNAASYLKQFSNDFEKAFLSTLKMRHGTKKCNANNVYQEMIADKLHVHMNATHWTTLTDFVQYLGRTKKCIVEQNNSDGMGGWNISYIERDAGMLARQEAQQRREAADKRAEQALLDRMKIQRIEAAKAMEKLNGGTSVKLEATSIQGNPTSAQPIKMGITSNMTKSAKKQQQSTVDSTKLAFGGDDDDSENDTFDEKPKTKASQTNVEAIMEETRNRVAVTNSDSATKKRRYEDNKVASSESKSKRSKPSKSNKEANRNDDDSRRSKKEQGWLYRDIVVRVVSEKLEGGKYFRKKAVVDRVLDDGFAAEVEILPGKDDKGGDILRLDQRDLETVMPKSGTDRKQSRVRILRGKFRGEKATVDYLDKSKYCADLLLKKSKKDEGKTVLRDVPYEDFSSII